MTADSPAAHAVLTVMVGPLVLYFTFNVPVGILVIKCSKLSLFMFWKRELADSLTNSDILVRLEPNTPKQMPTLSLF